MDDRRRRNHGSESENLALRIVNLSERRQQIIRPVLANPRKFVLLRVRDLAKELGTDAATVVRIVRGLGFENYRAFQHHLHEASLFNALLAACANVQRRRTLTLLRDVDKEQRHGSRWYVDGVTS